MDGEVDIDAALHDDQMMNGYDHGNLVKYDFFICCKNAEHLPFKFMLQL